MVLVFCCCLKGGAWVVEIRHQASKSHPDNWEFILESWEEDSARNERVFCRFLNDS